MDKSAVIRRLTQVRTVENVRAVPPGAAKSAPASVPDFVQRELENASSEAKADLRSLQEAGWTFGAQQEAPPDAAFELVVDADGHLKLAGRALTVKISPDLDRQAVETLLSRMRLKLRRKLGFAPNTFLLETEEGSALKAAKALNDLSEVLYAEPSLVEPIQSR